MKVTKIWVPSHHLVPQAAIPPNQDIKGRIQALRRELLELLTRQRFVAFEKQADYFYDNQHNILWLLYGFQSTPRDMFNHVARLHIYAFGQWEIPSLELLHSVAGEGLFLSSRRIRDRMVLSSTRAAQEGDGYAALHLESGQTDSSDDSHTILPIHRISHRDILSFVLHHALMPRDLPGAGEIIRELIDLTESQAIQSPNPPPSLPALQRLLLEGDYLRARLPVLEPSYLNDMEKGLWELYQPAPPQGNNWTEILLEEPWEARNPEIDLRDGAVAIDFGTSSTVVACREHGKTSLLRVGMNDFFQSPTPEDYQNPTVLAFLNLPGLLASWNRDTYRPLTQWDHFHFSHEALTLLRENQGNQQVVASLLTGIKQWPLKASEQRPLRIADLETGTEMELRFGPIAAPAAGQPLVVQEDDPLDPIELYAYYLGLFINHRSSGVFLEYYMTFPITYPRKVKERILASFARGLQRSLPPSLASSPHMKQFSVREEGSEPAAYAACALEELALETTREGLAYGVFDFGGGSTDFDYGIYRQPTKQEERQGYESVIEHFGASGDMYLGGENLVANLVYLVFQQNLDLCRQHRIPFICPQDAERFPGHEAFIDQSHVAMTNSALLMPLVRPIWEDFQWSSREEPESANTPENGKRPRRKTDLLGDALCRAISGPDFAIATDSRAFKNPDKKGGRLPVELLTRERQKVAVELKIDRNPLNHFLVRRVGKGLQRYFIAMTQAFAGRTVPGEIHILLAGNSSQSLLVQALFVAVLQEKMAGWTPPGDKPPACKSLEELRKSVPFQRIVVHRPPAGDPNNLYHPTAKTGVAIGLLKLLPGETLLALGPTGERVPGEAPFRYFVGRFKKERFQPVLSQNGPYEHWEKLGVPTRNTFVLGYTTSPQASTGSLTRGAGELREKSLRFPPGSDNAKLYIKAVGPTAVEICYADALDQLKHHPEAALYRAVVELN